MNVAIYKQVEREFEKKRLSALAEVEQKKAQLLKSIDGLKELEDRLNTEAINQAKNLIKAQGIDKQIAEENFSLKIESIKQDITKLIERHGYDKDYLEPKFECLRCKDTGLITKDGSNIYCNCFMQRVVDITYKQNNMLKLKEENFNTYDTCYFSCAVDKDKYGSDKSPLENMENIRKLALDFCENIDNEEQKSLLLIGNTGTGKTFISSAIADKVIKSGHTVLYQTAPILMDMMIEAKIKGARDEKLKEQYENIFNVDLLIIDDLGTETLNDIKFTELFNIINTRLLKSKKTIISTNLMLPELAETYDERVMSRLIGNYVVCKFFGDDIRLKKKKMGE